MKKYRSNRYKVYEKPTTANFDDLTGEEFGRLTVREYGGVKNRHHYWICECDCGNFTKVRSSYLRIDHTTTCGCVNPGTIHGMRDSITYASYLQARLRCENPKSKNYNNYGGRGIEFKFETFQDFFKEAGKRPAINYSIERMDVNGHYEPGNVRWTTPLQQANNTRRNVRLTRNGMTMSLSDWARRKRCEPSFLRIRLAKGWCDECALSIRKDKRKHICVHKESAA
jgi:hypothetical protein